MILLLQLSRLDQWHRLVHYSRSPCCSSYSLYALDSSRSSGTSHSRLVRLLPSNLLSLGVLGFLEDLGDPFLQSVGCSRWTRYPLGSLDSLRTLGTRFSSRVGCSRWTRYPLGSLNSLRTLGTRFSSRTGCSCWTGWLPVPVIPCRP